MCPVDTLCRYDVYVKCLRKLNLDPRVYKGHSFRIGTATHSAMRGYSYSQIASMGRWISSAFTNYIRIPKIILMSLVLGWGG